MESCPKCKSKRVNCIAKHNNRRKQVPIYLYECVNCKKRFTIEGNPNEYNHKGNLLKRKHMCGCGKKLGDDTERFMGCCFECLGNTQEHFYPDLTLQEHFEQMMDFAENW